MYRSDGVSFFRWQASYGFVCLSLWREDEVQVGVLLWSGRSAGVV